MKEFNYLKAVVSDHEYVISESFASYVALVMFDFSKRKINRSNNVLCTTLEGDCINSAFDHFLTTDESYGMIEDDRECMIVICEDWL